MKKLLLLILPFLLNFSNAKAQYVIETKNIKAKLFPIGDLFYDGMPWISGPGFEIPKNSGKSTIFAGQLWLGGIDSASSELIVSAQTYRLWRSAWFAGPIANNYNGNYDAVYSASISEVINHQNNFLNPTYVVPQNFMDWPAHGDVTNGESANLAPYIDMNQNGTYDPENGDHPRVRGNSAFFTLTNDVRDTFPIPNPNLGVEVKSYIYDLSYESPELENTLFFNYKIKNKSSRTYESFYASIWMDFDIGFPADDYMGSDSAMSMFFGYNADNFDENGYEANPPAQGLMFLSHPMSSFLTYNNTANPVNGNADSDQQHYNYMTSKWRDGTNVTYGGNGIDQTNPASNFMYSGNGWTEEAVSNTPSDRRGLGSIGPFTLRPNEELSFDFVLLYFRNDSVSNFANRDSLLQVSIDVNNYYLTKIVGIGKDLNESSSLITIYPNPAKDVLMVNSNKSLENISIYDNMGRTVKTIELNNGIDETRIDISDLPRGFYLIVGSGENARVTKRFIKD